MQFIMMWKAVERWLVTWYLQSEREGEGKVGEGEGENM